MFAVNHPITDPYLNHAIEEIAAKRYGECFILWENSPAILLGKHQNARREINFPYVEEKGIAVVRRITGGGAVYNDGGNLNFTFISDGGRLGDFGTFTAPVSEALKKAGVPAELSGRNDLTANGKKFSGNAQCRLGDKILHHGTLLFDADLEAMAKALTPDIVKFEGKGVKSVSSRVTNIAQYMKGISGIREFKDYLFRSVKESLGAKEITLTESDIKAAEELASGKYRTPKWNLGETRPFNIRREKRFQWGTIAAEIYSEGGAIKEISFAGDFFSQEEPSELAALMKGVPYEKDAVEKILKEADAEKYFAGIAAPDLLSLII